MNLRERLSGWFAARDFLSHIASDPTGLLKHLKMRHELRVRLILIGSLMAAAGFFIPWYLVTLQPPGGSAMINGHQYVTREYSWINGPGFLHAARDVGAHSGAAGAAEIVTAIFAAFATGVYLLVFTTQHSSVLMLIGAQIPKIIHVVAVTAFIKAQLGALLGMSGQHALRLETYNGNGGGKVGELVASWVYLIPLPGFFVMLFGLAISAIGLYSGTSRDGGAPAASRAEGGSMSILLSLQWIFVGTVLIIPVCVVFALVHTYQGLYGSQ